MENETGYQNDITESRKRKGSQSPTEHMDNQRIRDIGRRTRTRFEEEKSKRKEIVRIDDSINQEKIGVSSSKSSFLSSVKKTKTAQRPTTNRRKKNALEPLGSTEKPSHVDLWFPSTKTKSSLTTSKLVRIHGLPSTGTTISHIRKYFLGLDIKEIFLLPKMNLHIPNFDAELTNSPKNIVARFTHTVRVIVQFPSSNVADIAVDRSGETIAVGENVAAVSVSPIDEIMSDSLQKMAIYLPNDASMTIKDFVESYLDNIPECINTVLWYDVLNRFGDNSIPNVIKGKNVSISSAEMDSIYPTTKKDDRNLLIALYNNILDMYTDIEEELPHVQLSRLDPIKKHLDVTERLAIETLEWLEFQMKRIEKCLLHVDIQDTSKGVF